MYEKLCVTEKCKLLEVPARYKYNQLEPMCEDCFNKVVEAVELILHTKIDRNTHLLNKKAVSTGRLSW
jgi:hypothetical protein